MRYLRAFAARSQPRLHLLRTGGLRLLILGPGIWLSTHVAQAAGTPGLSATLSGLPYAVALAGMLRWGPGVWPALVLPALGLSVVAGRPLEAATASALALLIGPLTAAVLLRHLGWGRRLRTPRDIGLFLVIGVAWACGVGALAAAAAEHVNGTLSAGGWLTWLRPWLHNTAATLAVGTPLLLLSPADCRGIGTRGAVRLGATLAAVAAACAGVPIVLQWAAAWPLLFVPHLVLAWLAAHAGLAAASSAALIVSAASVLAVRLGLGPAFAPVAEPPLDWLWSYLLTLAATPLWVRAFTAHATQSGDGTASNLAHAAATPPASRPAVAASPPADAHLALTLFEHLPEGLLITDGRHRVLGANATFCRITGFARNELLGAVPVLLQPAPPDSTAAGQQALMWQSLADTGRWHGVLDSRRQDQTPCTFRVGISAVGSAAGAAERCVLVVSDVTEAHRRTERLQRQARYDELTGLPNRAQLPQLLADAMKASEREGFLLTVCCLDLDHFKPLNDRLGHSAGDRLLAELAQRLSGLAGPSGAARLGGDEFVLLLRSATVEEARQAVERMLRRVSEPYSLVGATAPVVVTASGGATVYPLDHADADTLMRHADHAMYGAKQSGRNGYLFFDAELDRRTEARFEAIARVHEALQQQEFVLYYQPKVDMRRGTVLGVEALLRWRHPQHGVIAPAQFLPLIEHTGLSVRVGDWVLQQAVEQLAGWRAQGLDISVSVNVSARHLQEPLFAQRLAELLGAYPASVARGVIIEVLETAALADVDHTVDLMAQCQAMGIRFALDDFGTGYSTLTYLKRLPVDLLKIDRSFVLNMLDDRQDLAIVENVISLSRTFGCTVVAEGVESDSLAQRLIELGCDAGQGNGIAAAMPAEEVGPWVQAWRRAPREDGARVPESAGARLTP